MAGDKEASPCGQRQRSKGWGYTTCAPEPCSAPPSPGAPGTETLLWSRESGVKNHGINRSLKEARLGWNAYALGTEWKTLTKADFGLAETEAGRGILGQQDQWPFSPGQTTSGPLPR